jgi:hypothetical protein
LQCAGLVVTPKLSGRQQRSRVAALVQATDLRKATKNVATDAYW